MLGSLVLIAIPLVLMATVREVFGNGTFMGMSIPVLSDNHISILTMAPGGFFENSAVGAGCTVVCGFFIILAQQPDKNVSCICIHLNIHLELFR